MSLPEPPPATNPATSLASSAPLAAAEAKAAWLWLGLAGLTVLSVLGNLMLWGKLSGMQQHLAEASAQAQMTAQEAKATAQAMADRSESNQAKIALLDAKLEEMTALNQQLQGILQQATRTQSSNVLTDVEASLRLAQQQAQFTHNPQPLLDALTQAQNRLTQGSDASVLLKPALQAVQRDLQRLQAANYPDIASAVDQLDAVLNAVDDLPLWAEQPAHAAHTAVRHGVASSEQPPPAADGQSWIAFWQKWRASFAAELRALVQIERMDAASVASGMNAQQEALLREQVRLYVLSARTAMLSGRLPAAGQALALLQTRLPQYFDTHTAAYAKVLRQLSQARAALGSGAEVLPSAMDSINTMAQLNERLSTAPAGSASAAHAPLGQKGKAQP